MKYILIIMLSVATVIIGCKQEPKPDHFGVFLKEKGALLELNKISKKDELYQIKKLGAKPEIHNTSPSFIFYHTELPVSQFHLYKAAIGAKGRGYYEYYPVRLEECYLNISPIRGEKGMFLLTSKELLQNGFYLFSKTDFRKETYLHRLEDYETWWFSIFQMEKEVKEALIPDHFGIFVSVEGKLSELSPTEKIEAFPPEEGTHYVNIESRIPSFIFYHGEISVSKLCLCILSPFGKIKSASPFEENRPPFHIAPIKGYAGMYKLACKDSLDKGRYAFAALGEYYPFGIKCSLDDITALKAKEKLLSIVKVLSSYREVYKKYILGEDLSYKDLKSLLVKAMGRYKCEGLPPVDPYDIRASEYFTNFSYSGDESTFTIRANARNSKGTALEATPEGAKIG